ncbi:hypothetical protein [Comamonas sediminis]|uniref:Tail fiber protein n=1 Tax=Comamonas sediminis TaxID=1783360 RepID=A0ABV4B1W8_9BURK
MPLVVPTPVPAYPPAPQPTDDRVTFSTKAFALAASYEPQRLAFNVALDQVYTNAQWAQAKALDAQNAATAAGQSANAANASRVAADTAVQDVRDAMDAIQAGPVASVMGRTGVVVGLVERSGPIYTKATSMADAPLGQWASYNDGTGAGADWPTTLTISCWNVFTFGTALRKTQRATQVLEGTQQGWTFERQLHDAAWSPWARVFTASAVIEQVKLHSNVSGAITCDPAAGSMHMVGMAGNLAINIPAPRAMGDQLTIRIYQTGSFSLTFGSNVALPVGATLPTLAFGEWLTVTLCTDNGLTKWFLFVAGRHAG